MFESTWRRRGRSGQAAIGALLGGAESFEHRDVIEILSTLRRRTVTKLGSGDLHADQIVCVRGPQRNATELDRDRPIAQILVTGAHPGSGQPRTRRGRRDGCASGTSRRRTAPSGRRDPARAGRRPPAKRRVELAPLVAILSPRWWPSLFPARGHESAHHQRSSSGSAQGLDPPYIPHAPKPCGHRLGHRAQVKA